MITILSGTNRKNSTTLHIVKMVKQYLEELQTEVQVVDLEQLPEGIFHPNHYKDNVPSSLQAFEDLIVQGDGLLVVTPEYNGSFPGVLKYFLDLLSQKALREKPSAFIGIGSGDLSGRTPVEQLQSIFLYREAHLFGPRFLVRQVNKELNAEKDQFVNSELKENFHKLLESFLVFVNQLKKK